MSKRTKRRAKARRPVALASAGAISVHRLDRSRVGSMTAMRSDAPPVGRSSEFSGADRVAVAVVPALLGAAAAMVLAGVDLTFGPLLGPWGVSDRLATSTVVGAVLLALAVGVRVPQRFTWWLCEQVWRRVVRRGPPRGLTEVWTRPSGPDRPLYWMLLSLLALSAGVLSSLLPMLMRGVSSAHGWLYEHFVWSAGPQAVLHAGLVFLVVALPMMALGAAIVCVHHLSCEHGRWDTKATGWVLIGAAAGGAASLYVVHTSGRQDLVVAMAASPVLLVSLVAATMGSSRGTRFERGEANEGLPLPVWSDRWPALMRASVVAVCGVGAYLLAVWIGHRSILGVPAGLFVPAMFAAGGVGVLAGCRRGMAGRRSIGGFGVCCVGSGAVVAIGLFAGGAGSRVPMEWPALCGMLAIGYTTAYGRQALLHRVADRSSTGATVLVRMLVCAGLVVWVGAPLAEYRVGMPFSLLAAALLLVAVGGVLIIYEPDYSSGMRRMRLGVVFGALGLMIALVI